MLAEDADLGRGRMKLALFDLDGTLLPIDSDHAFGEFLIALGWADGDEPTGAQRRLLRQYLAERLDIDAYVDFCHRALARAGPRRELAQASQRFRRRGGAAGAAPQRAGAGAAAPRRRRPAGRGHRHQRLRHAADRQLFGIDR
jgi:phosphoserine phosphatase